MTQITTERTLKYMKKALELAVKCKSEGEVPVGCVIVSGDEIIAVGENTVEREKDRLGHAEMNAIKAALRKMSDAKGYPARLSSCEMYVTLEPCSMCAGAIVNAGLGRLFFGAYDPERGACLSARNITGEGPTEVYGGIMEEECAGLLEDFFCGIRKKKETRQDNEEKPFYQNIDNSDDPCDPVFLRMRTKT